MGVDYCCSSCDRSTQLREVSASAGGTDGSARAQGWRLGPPVQRGARVRHCPACSGVDAGYWARRTLSLAVHAGVVAGTKVRG